MRQTVAFITLGCKINQYETEAVREQLLGLGFEAAEPGAVADVCVVNTCSVTATAGAKSRRSVLRAARRHPGARIVVVGCSTAAEKRALGDIPQVVLVAGNAEKARVGGFLLGRWRPGDREAAGEPDTPGLLDLGIRRWPGRTRAIVKVQDGCSNGCSFCVIPRLRGGSRSRPPDAVLDEVRGLVEGGTGEIVVSGVHLEAYGRDLDPCLSLAELLGRVATVEGLQRVRMSSLGARAFTPALIDCLEHPVFCRHWHVPIQAGTDDVLRAMRRGYSLADYVGAVDALRARFDEPAITTDVIVGHPGESDTCFAESLAVYRQLGFAKMHVFPFSARAGTRSAKLPHPIDPEEIRRRAEIVGALDRELGVAYRERFLGRTLEVLVEGRARGGRPDQREGLTERYVRVRFARTGGEGPEPEAGTLRRVEIREVTGEGLAGRLVETPAGFLEGPATCAPGATGARKER